MYVLFGLYRKAGERELNPIALMHLSKLTALIGQDGSEQAAKLHSASTPTRPVREVTGSVGN